MEPKPFDAHDDDERREIIEILKELPEDHRAWRAHREGADALALSRRGWTVTEGYFDERAALGGEREGARRARLTVGQLYNGINGR